jgi:hypothetical protein
MCWTGAFNLQPDFFAAIPTQSSDSLQIRVQNGGNFESFSDGVEFLIDDVAAVQLGQTLPVSLPVGVAAPGVPIVANPNPSIVHATLYLQQTCRTQNVALYALSAVTLAADGSCGETGAASLPAACSDLTTGSLDAGDATTKTGPSADAATGDAGDAGTASATVATGPIGMSTIVFSDLFDGNPNESDASKRLTDVPHFDLYFADPRDIAPGGLGPPPPCLAHLEGSFSFYFEIGSPEQPFP